ncbi:MAG: GSCFA domain-containing protein [Saprospiraceae bacterium]|nr:GSCFA domain-containing protein [Saprospiraceae bacterium]
MMEIKWRTTIEIQELEPKILYSQKILSLGSCFSVEIAQKLKSLQYQIFTNPAGITFNPISILTILKRVFSSDSLPEDQLNNQNGIWSHSDFHSSFNKSNKEDYILNANLNLSRASEFIRQTEYVFITIGTAFVFEDLKTGNIVNNCHKRPSNCFKRQLLTKEQIKEALSEIKQLLDDNSQKEINFIFTLSPVRHTRDGIVENMHSKAICLNAIHEFINENDRCHYFPSFEIMIDDLRDYRFYKRDLIHPNDLALDIIFNRFEKFGLFEKEEDLRNRIKNVNQSLQHKPLFPDSEEYKKFEKNRTQKINDLTSQYPWMQF